MNFKCLRFSYVFIQNVTSQKDNCSSRDSPWEALVQFLGCFEPRWLLCSIRRLCGHCPREQSVSNCKLIVEVRAPSVVISNILHENIRIWCHSWRDEVRYIILWFLFHRNTLVYSQLEKKKSQVFKVMSWC